MSSRFPIEDLRTLVARALQVGSYSPAESKRVRAVPDTRTIRYYTTLGLIDRPAEMQGRTALYEAQHVMQLVAIKRLQAANQTLSDVQQRLVGISRQQLKKLADLPEGFWESAEHYLSRKRQDPATANLAAPPEQSPKHAAAEDDPREFWSEPAALPLPQQELQSRTAEKKLASDMNRSLHLCWKWEPLPGVRILIDGSQKDFLAVDMERLRIAAEPLLNELVRQGFVNDNTDLIARFDPLTHSHQGPNPSLPPEVTP